MAADEKIQYSLRMDRKLYEQVRTISKLKQSPISKVLLTAIQNHAERQTKSLQQQLLADLKTLQKYEDHDPGFEHAIARIAEAEVTESGHEVEGRIFQTDAGHQQSAAAAVDVTVLEEFLENA